MATLAVIALMTGPVSSALSWTRYGRAAVDWIVEVTR
jgi:hypothetical protein